MTVELSQFRRIVPPRTWSQSAGIRLIVWSLLAAISLAALLLVAYLTLDLVTYRGRIQVAPEENPTLAAYVTEVDGEGIGEDLGLRSVLWRNRECPCARMIRTPLCRFIPLRSNRATLATLLIAGVFLGLAWIWSLRRAARSAHAIALDSTTTLRSQIHRQIMRLGPGDLDQRDSRVAQSLFHGACDAIASNLVTLLSTGLYEVLAGLFILGLQIGLDWSITFQSLVPLMFTYGVMRWISARETEKRSRAESQAVAGLQALSEGLQKSRIVRGYGMDAVEQDRFLQHLRRHSRNLLAAVPGDWLSWMARVIAGLLLAVVAFLCGSRVLGTGTPLDIPKALTILAGFGVLIPIVRGFSIWPAARQTIEREGVEISRFLSILPEVGQAVGARFVDPVSQSIQFEDVHYTRDGRPLLKGFDLRIPAGTALALVAPDPHAARAVAALIPRFIEPQKGRVLFDGEDIAWGTLESIRAEAIYVGGDDSCFSGTVSENIRCGDTKYDTTQIMEAAKLTHAHQFIQKLPLGYETVLGENGHRLTPGQAFLLGLARAMIRNPAVLIIDEPTANLDQATKDALDDTYLRIHGQRTVIFIPSRLSTVRRCDKVVVIGNGQVEAIGRQADLVKTCELYRHWEYVTFNVFRHAADKG